MLRRPNLFQIKVKAFKKEREELEEKRTIESLLMKYFQALGVDLDQELQQTPTRVTNQCKVNKRAWKLQLLKKLLLSRFLMHLRAEPSKLFIQANASRREKISWGIGAIPFQNNGMCAANGVSKTKRKCMAASNSKVF